MVIKALAFSDQRNLYSFAQNCHVGAKGLGMKDQLPNYLK